MYTQTDNTELAHGLLSPYSCAPANSTVLHHSLVPSYRVYSERNCAFASARSVLEAKINCSRFRLHKEGTTVSMQVVSVYIKTLLKRTRIYKVSTLTDQFTCLCIFDFRKFPYL